MEQDATVSPPFSLAVQRQFVAQHYLVGGDWGAENQLHSHHYRLEVQIDASSLDRHGYCVDIVEVERTLDDLVATYRDRTLNDLPQFAGLNPSIEHFARIACETVTQRLSAPNLVAFTVRIWENDIAWASCCMDARPTKE
jgi:6-pyruvoyltetrahydropterin/6-carboxytetrahydropterin synthase